jgi:hypothetical protein
MDQVRVQWNSVYDYGQASTSSEVTFFVLLMMHLNLVTLRLHLIFDQFFEILLRLTH